MVTNQISLYDVSVVSDFALLLFGGDTESVPSGLNMCLKMMSGMYIFEMEPSVAHLIEALRSSLQEILRKSIEDPTLNKSHLDNPIVKAMFTLLGNEFSI